MDWFLSGLGLIILLLSGDALVKGAVNLSLRLGIPALIVSLTVVAFGTSAPELLISIAAVLDHAPGIALGNVVGSNTANVLLVLGVPAMMTGLATSGCDTRHSYLMMITASVAFIIACFIGPITWMHGIFLLAGLTAMLVDQARRARNHRREQRAEVNDEEEVEGSDPSLPGWRIALFLGLGMVGLPLGADLLVDSGINIARRFGITETVIGLTLIAIGTSLPELATTVVAALRKNADVALGNVIGSNMFNLLAIIGVASMFGPIPVDPEFLRQDLWVMLLASLLLIPFVFMKWNLTRSAGVALTAAYLGYLWVLLS